MAMLKNIVYVDDQPSTRFQNLFFKKLPLFPIAQEQIDSTVVQGRPESLTRKTGYFNDISITLEAVIVDIFTEINEVSLINDIISWIASGKRLRLSSEPGKCAIIKQVSKYEQKRIGSKAAEVKITVKCYPFKREQANGYVSYKTSPQNFESRGNFDSEPKIEIRGIAGSCSVTLNGVTIGISGFSGTAVIDAENRIVYSEANGEKTSILERSTGEIWKLCVYHDTVNRISFSGCTEVRIWKNVRFI